MEEIMVSICCLAYNHERYIRKCLDGFLMQECDFRFEVLIHEDASTDHTAEIIREYEEKYPDVIKPIYQTENQYSKKIGIGKTYQYPRARGKYIAWCEGDDYWTDPQKLQKQVDALETNPQCRFSVHRVNTVRENGEPMQEIFPEQYKNLKTGVMSADIFLENECSSVYTFQTSSYLANARDMKRYSKDMPQFAKSASVGDLPIKLYFATIGDVYYFAEPMSCYRRGSVASLQRTSSFSGSYEKLMDHYAPQLKAMKEFDKYTDGKYHRLCVRKNNALVFNAAMLYHKYREMIKPKYWYFIRKYPTKAQIKILLYAVIPKIMEDYDKRKHNERF